MDLGLQRARRQRARGVLSLPKRAKSHRLDHLQKSFLSCDVERTEGPNHAGQAIVVSVEVGQWHAERLCQTLRRLFIWGVDALLVSVDARASHERIQTGEDAQIPLGYPDILARLPQAPAEDG